LGVSFANLKWWQRALEIARVVSLFTLHLGLNIAVDGLNAVQNFRRDLAAVNDRDQVYLPPYFDDHTLDEIRRMFLTSRIRAVEVLRDVFAASDQVEALYRNWVNDYWLDPDRLPILRSALDAHVRSEFTVSIPLMVGAVEGIILEAFGIDQSKVRETVRRAFPVTSGNTTQDMGSFVMNELFLNQIMNSNQKEGYKANGKFPHRHRIQHGIDITYYKDEFASTRLILVLDYLLASDFKSKVIEHKANPPRSKACRVRA
jgi:hypothetical protein